MTQIQFLVLVGLFVGFWLGVACGMGLMIGLEALDRRARRRAQRQAEAILPQRKPSPSRLYRDLDGDYRVLPRGAFGRACAAADKRLAQIRSCNLKHIPPLS